MAEVHRLQVPNALNLEMACDTIGKVAGSLGLLAMISGRVDDNEMVVDPNEFAGMMETLRSELIGAKKMLVPDA
jgi:hypothetical protein